MSHLYNLRNRADYQAQRVRFTSTRAVCNSIGQRKAPRPNGRAGYMRIDTVHQGDLDGAKGGQRQSGWPVKRQSSWPVGRG